MNAVVLYEASRRQNQQDQRLEQWARQVFDRMIGISTGNDCPSEFRQVTKYTAGMQKLGNNFIRLFWDAQ